MNTELLVPTKEQVKSLGMVFTPLPLVNDMLDKLPKDVFLDPEKTFLDPACGNGNFLIVVLERKLASGIEYQQAIKTIYGVDIDQKNITECKQRLSIGSDNPAIWEILNHNVICADALNPEHAGWKEVGYMWDESKKIVDLVEAGFFTFGDDIVGT
jgi:SAM-dependent methyltransferase